MRKTLDICESDIMAELDALRPTASPWRRQFTSEQDSALLAARDCDQGRRVTWDNLVSWWTARWGLVNQDTLRKRLRELQAEKERS